MIKPLTALPALLLLTGITACCTTPPPATPDAETVAEMDAKLEQAIIIGKLAYRERIALTPGHILTVTLNDVSIADRPSIVLAEYIDELDDQQVPLPFELRVKTDELSARNRYAVRGMLQDSDGNLVWTTDTVHMIDPSALEQDLGLLNMVRVRSAPASTAPTLIGREWIVEDVASTGIIDNSRLTLNFDKDGRLSGSSGCNQYTTSYETTDSALALDAIATTRKMCPPALMNQEGKFLSVLHDTASYSFAETGALVVTAKDGRTLKAMPASD